MKKVIFLHQGLNFIVNDGIKKGTMKKADFSNLARKFWSPITNQSCHRRGTLCLQRFLPFKAHFSNKNQCTTNTNTRSRNLI